MKTKSQKVLGGKFCVWRGYRGEIGKGGGGAFWPPILDRVKFSSSKIKKKNEGHKCNFLLEINDYIPSHQVSKKTGKSKNPWKIYTYYIATCIPAFS